MDDLDHLRHQEQQDAADREQIDLHRDEGRSQAEARLKWLLQRYNQAKGWTSNDD